MPEKSPAEVMRDLKGKGVLLLMDEVFYFIPESALKDLALPDGFQKGAEGIDPDFFFKMGRNAAQPEHSVVFDGLKKIVTEELNERERGVTAAVKTEGRSVPGRPFDGATMVAKGNPEKEMFSFKAAMPPVERNWERIWADMSKGGKPSKPLV
jgi:hypothetical protein